MLKFFRGMIMMMTTMIMITIMKSTTILCFVFVVVDDGKDGRVVAVGKAADGDKDMLSLSF